MFAETVHVAAFSANQRPTGELVPLDKDSYRLSYWLSVIEAETPARLDALRPCASAMRVCFLLVQGNEDLERQRWKLSASTTSLSSNMVLLGYKRIVGITMVKDALHESSCLASIPSPPWCVMIWQAIPPPSFLLV